MLGTYGKPILLEVEPLADELFEKVKDKWYGYYLYASWALREALGELTK